MFKMDNPLLRGELVLSILIICLCLFCFAALIFLDTTTLDEDWSGIHFVVHQDLNDQEDIIFISYFSNLVMTTLTIDASHASQFPIHFISAQPLFPPPKPVVHFLFI